MRGFEWEGWLEVRGEPEQMVVVWKDAEELNQKKFLECNGLALSVALGVRQFT